MTYTDENGIVNTEKLSEDIVHAMDLAIETHAEQYDKYGRSYLFHITQVAGMTRTDEEFIVAWLHDYVEHSESEKECEETLRKRFPDEIVEAVLVLVPKSGDTQKDYLSRVAKNPIAVKVKYYDLRSNCDIVRLKKLPLAVAKKLVARYAVEVDLLRELGALSDRQLDFMNKAKKMFLG